MAYTIRELESLSGIRAHTIRIWEQRYHFLRPSRTPTNIRTYSGNELKTLLTVALLNKYGYRISRIDEMPAEERTKAILRLPQPDARIEFAVNTMIGFMADLDSAGLEAFLDAWITGNGLEQAVTTLIFRFMDKVGILWQTSRILPAQEHLVSCIIRQKIIAAIDKLPAVHNRKTRFVLLLPEYEHHEIGLLFVLFLLRKKQQPAIYLGANVPLQDTLFLVQRKSPEFIYMHITSITRQKAFAKYLAGLREKAGASRLLLSGASIRLISNDMAENTTVFPALQDVMSFIDGL